MAKSGTKFILECMLLMILSSHSSYYLAIYHLVEKYSHFRLRHEMTDNEPFMTYKNSYGL